MMRALRLANAPDGPPSLDQSRIGPFESQRRTAPISCPAYAVGLTRAGGLSVPLAHSSRELRQSGWTRRTATPSREKRWICADRLTGSSEFGRKQRRLLVIGSAAIRPTGDFRSADP